mmetsp:Transcript_58265/g.114617  ORF Transcript_58265/g.114617 Transcript_58265/m.114617 type:complete len:208 (+) Transcript_58265:133-756(+)
MFSELLPEEKRKLFELEQQLMELENGNMSIQVSDVMIGLNEMEVRLDDLDKLVAKESKGRREDCRVRVQQLRANHSHVKDSLAYMVRRRNRNKHEANKADLFAESNRNIEAGDVEAELAENSSLQKSGKMLNEYIAVGQETMSNLVSQKERLKGIQRKAFDILNSLGIANSLMKAVEGRDAVDKWIVYGGMLFIIVLIVLVYIYLAR